MNPHISIITPIYNSETHLKECIDSIIYQSFKSIEIILVNDGSTDKSGQICDKYAQADSRIKVIHQTNQGVSAARNAGLEIATGEYIHFVDSDDKVVDNCYQILAEHLSNSNCDILRFNAYRNNEIINKIALRGTFSNNQVKTDVLLPMLGSPKFGGMFMLGVLWLHVYKRDVIQKHNIRFNTNLRRCEDRLFTITNMMHVKKATFIDDALYHYSVNNSSLSNKYDNERWQQELIYMESVKQKYIEVISSDISSVETRFNNDYLLRAIISIHGEFFSVNNNSFNHKYKRIKEIINNPNVIKASKNIQKQAVSAKDNVILFLIKHKYSMLLCIFEGSIAFVNKLKNQNG